ncbi:hypothetical protein PPERSA_03380 [Pseudocohnilembus persalinus]|uniref:Uncharacterized protein n=1 Tax=Pseudocohnilembus persalinus TaxID=266149 RepID=A0A0V0R1I8_PSEPJ|nr:hypothetical protein PPERSA_03380 [Pseudocohnilembus persalinus]|eukprot:KRX08386.1 hypothetical protein PPERSA_03380 [Pseudocohnilembus persalinus]
MEVEDQNQVNQDNDIVKEIDVIYVPIDYSLFITQYPLRSKFDNQFDQFLKPVGCEFQPKQKKLTINYEKTSKFTNTREDLTQKGNKNQNDENFLILDKNKNKNQMEDDSDDGIQSQQAKNRKNQQKLLENQEDNDEDSNNNYSVQYVSKVINNKTTYFASHYDKQNNKIYLFPIDSYFQMRPIIKQDQNLKSQKSQQQDIKKLSKEIERERNLLQKHPDKYLEARLKNWKSYQEIYDSEKPQKLKYQDISKSSISLTENNIQEQQEQEKKNLKKNPLLRKKPNEIIDLPNCTKQTYINRMEGQPLVERKAKKPQ